MKREVNIKTVRAVERALKIVSVFSFEQPELTLSEIVEKTNLNRTTVYRLLYTLEQKRFISYNADSGTYSLGIKFFELGGVFSSNFSEKNVIDIYLDKLMSKVNHTILVARLFNDELLYIDKRESRNELRVTSEIGRRRPPNYGILGKILMAYLSEKEIYRLLKKYPLKKYTERSITSEQVFLDTLKRIRENGYYIAHEETMKGVVGIGAPIFKNKSIYASFGIIAPKSIMSDQEIEECKELVVRYSKMISSDIG